ncbi:MAG: prolipoprotein diacylglyceryl transferase [Alistipes sp.]|nr:prolipoprotein diacylglyceryl transferase [Alistipes sp.]
MNILLSVVWDFDPTLFSIGSLEVRYYGVTWVIALMLGGWWFMKWTKRDGYPDKTYDNVFWFGILGTVIGARLGHCLFYDPAYYLAHPIEILYTRQGGMASHGAAIGLLTGLWLFSRKCKVPYIWSLDRVMLPVTIGGAFVRLGNLLNSEIYGIETDLPWGFIFVRAGETVPKHPTQIYEALCYAATFAVLAWLFWKRDSGHKRPGLLFGVGLIGVFLSRFFIEYIKNPQEAFEENMSLMMGQWLSIPFIVLGIWLVVRSLRRPEAVDFPQPQPGSRPKSGKTKEDIMANIRPAKKQ